MELAAVVPDADYNEMHVAETRTSRSTGRSLALCCVLLYRHVTHSRTRLFFLLCLFQSPREGEEHETAALATRRLDQLPEMIRL